MRTISFAFIVVVAVGISLWPSPAAAALQFSSVDPVGYISLRGDTVLVSGPIVCSTGEIYSIGVSVAQTAPDALALGDTSGWCIGDIDHWQVRATRSPGSNTFTSGQAMVCLSIALADGWNIPTIDRRCAGATLVETRDLVTDDSVWTPSACCANIPQPDVMAADSQQPSVSPREALGRFIEARGERFAGLCAESQSPDDIGSRCATFTAERDGLRAYLTGRTFSEYSRWIFLRRGVAGWVVVAGAPLRFDTGDGSIPWPMTTGAAAIRGAIAYS